MTVIRLLELGLRTLSFPGTIRLGSLWSQRNSPGRELRSSRPADGILRTNGMIATWEPGHQGDCCRFELAEPGARLFDLAEVAQRDWGWVV
jgi:hypothetical protein